MICCSSIKELPAHMALPAMRTAVKQNPANRVPAYKLRQVIEMAMSVLVANPSKTADDVITPQHVAVLTSKWWGNEGVSLTVGFMEPVAADLASRIVSHMNAWKQYCNVKFQRSANNPQVRITLKGDGYWSYLGTDILHIPMNQPTMCLEGFSMQTPESEYNRVVRHETGHTLGCPHEHMRAEIVGLLDPVKTISYFLQTQGWSPQVTTQQVLTPVSESSIMGTPHADQTSIMCYQLPGLITKSGQAIPGGLDINALDGRFMSSIYPLSATPTNPIGPIDPTNPPSPGGPNIVQVVGELIAAIEAKDLPAIAKLLNELIALLVGPAGNAPKIALKKTKKGRKLVAS